MYDITTSIFGNGTVNCTTPVEYGYTTTCTVTAAPFYHLSDISGCGGSLFGETYTIGTITSACIISASFVNNSNNFAITIR
jgi:hypothetical protein